ncbi:MAG: hypothetical protein HYX32_12010 [Actinobacteria bacterium]|nr:hypothetical protein [Actinomycetota bacterium]
MGVTRYGPTLRVSPRARRWLPLAVAALAVSAMGCRPAPPTSPPSNAANVAPLATKAPRVADYEVWCKKLDELPKMFDSSSKLKPSDLPALVGPFTELRDTAPEDVKPDFETLLAFTNKAIDTMNSQDLNTIGTSQEQVLKWVTDNFGPDGVTKFKDALTRIFAAQANNC